MDVQKRVEELEKESTQLNAALPQLEEQKQQIIQRIIEIRGALVELKKLNTEETKLN